MRARRGRRLLVGLGAIVTVLLAGVAAQAPAVASVTKTALIYGRAGVPQRVDFRNLPSPSAHPPMSLPFRPRSSIAFASAKQAAQAGQTPRRTGVIDLARSPANTGRGGAVPNSSMGPAAGGSQTVVSSFALADRSLQMGWFPPGTDQQVEPPDTQLAIGDTQLMELTNSSGSVWTKTGSPIAQVDLNAFFVDPAFPTRTGVTDPRIIYDSATQRWFVSALGFVSNATTADSSVYLARSDTADPTKTWLVYMISRNTAAIQDQPKIGVTSDKVVMTWNDFNFSNAFTGEETLVFQKSDIVSGVSAHFVRLTSGPDLTRFNVIPVQDGDGSSTAYLAYNVLNSKGQSIGQLGLVTIGGTPLAGSVTGFQTELDLPVAQTAIPPNADQAGSTLLLATNDDAFTAAVVSNGSLWVAGNDACRLPSDTATRSCARLILVTLVGFPGVVQDVDVSESGSHLFFPAVSLDVAGNMAVVFTKSSTTSFASVFAAGQAAGTIGSFARQSPVAIGLGHYDCGICSTGFGAERWGDYSAAAPDPTTGDLWVAGEYAASATNAADWGTAAADLSVSPSRLKTAVSRAQYRLDNSDGTTWMPMDVTHLSLTFAPTASGSAILDANVDLWTANAGYNQDVGIGVSGGAAPTAYPTVAGQPEAWKESGGFAGTFSPNAAFVQTVLNVTAGQTYQATLVWKANKPASGAAILVGAGPFGGTFSPTRLTVRLVESGSIAQTAVSTQQYIRSSGGNWIDMDSTKLALNVPATAGDVALLSGNADLWTANAGFNQDLGIAVNGSVVAWKESGGFAGTFSPNAAFVQTVLDTTTVAAGFHVSLQWKTNTALAGGQIRAGAGLGPFSPTRLTVELVPKSSVATGVSTPDKQYRLAGSDGQTWQAMDPTLLHLNFTATGDCFAIVSANVDLWTANAGVNQDIGITLSDAAIIHFPAIIGWKESGGFAGTFSPNAAYFETILPVYTPSTYDLTVVWKSNFSTAASIFAGAGLSPNFSPTRITAQLICS